MSILRKSPRSFKVQCQKLKDYFDAHFYLENNPDVAEAKLDPLRHFVEHGWQEGRDPSAAFDTSYYLETNPDVVEAGLNPFLHWIEHGKSEGRAPRDFAELQAEKEYERICAEFEGRFDKDYYLAQNEDVAKSGMDPLRHFILSGWMEGRDPCREFSTRFYLDTYQDVAAAGVNPFLHWLQTGQREGRLGKANGVSERELQEARKVLKGYFDASFYMKYNPDVVGAGVDPLRHYLDIGWKEGRDPSPDFSTLYYLDSYPDIAEAGINPLLHWVTAGQSEGRKGIDEAFRIQFRLAHLKEFPFEKVYQPAKSHKTAVHDDIRQRVEGKKIVLCISHDDYTVIPGGIQFCIRREQKAYNAKDVVYLHLCPTAHGMPLSVSNPKYALSVDGEKLGEISLRTLTASLKSLDLETDLIIHSLLSQKPSAVEALMDEANVKTVYYWLHDFYSVCTQFTLLRNDLVYCNAPGPDSNACMVCCYGAERAKRLEQFSAILKHPKTRLISPSQIAYDIHKRVFDLDDRKCVVHPHVLLEDAEQADLEHDRHNYKTDRFREEPVKIAFVGTPASHKGFEVFLKLVKKLEGENVEFYTYGKSKPQGLPAAVKHQLVTNTTLNETAVRDNLYYDNIDVVFSFAIWPETFSLTTVEAISAGCLVITSKDAGNVLSLVEQYDAGYVLEEEDLLPFIRFDVAEILRKRTKKIYRMRFSNMTLDIAEEMVQEPSGNE